MQSRLFPRPSTKSLAYSNKLYFVTYLIKSELNFKIIVTILFQKFLTVISTPEVIN